MNIINPTGLMNTDNQSAPLFAMLGRFSGGQKNVENVGRKSVAFYNKLFFPLAQPQSKSYQVSKWFSGSQFTVTTEQICPNVDQKDETWAPAGKTEWLTGLVYWHIHHSQTQQPLSHAVIFSAGLDTVSATRRKYFTSAANLADTNSPTTNLGYKTFYKYHNINLSNNFRRFWKGCNFPLSSIVSNLIFATPTTS